MESSDRNSRFESRSAGQQLEEISHKSITETTLNSFMCFKVIRPMVVCGVNVHLRSKVVSQKVTPVRVSHTLLTSGMTSSEWQSITNSNKHFFVYIIHGILKQISWNRCWNYPWLLTLSHTAIYQPCISQPCIQTSIILTDKLVNI